MINFVDSHCHLYYEPFVDNLNKTILESKKNNVSKFLSISVDYKTSKKNIELSNKYNDIFCTIGIHPNNTDIAFDDFEQVKSLYKNNKSNIIGIGEAGIDLYRSKDNLFKQIELFKNQIELSIEQNIPLVVHSRAAENETINVLERYKNSNLKFILHCFSGTELFAKKCLDLNGFLAFGGILTFANSENLRKVCLKVPMDKILLETDTPYLSPHPFRGKTNHPKNIKYIAECLSDIKKIKLEEVAYITTRNFNNLFNLK